jgi:hypothetical protein
MPEPTPNPAPSGQPNPPAPPAPNEVQQLRDTVTKLQNQLSEIQPFVEDASYLVSAIYSDPQLKQTVQTRLQQGYMPNSNPPANPANPPANPANPPANPANPPANPANPPANPSNPTPTYDPRLNPLDVKAREDIVSQIETKYGYTRLDKDARKTLRANVERTLNKWNTSVITAPVNTLPNLLEDAYLLNDLGKAKEEGRLEGLVDARNTEMGAIPTMGNQKIEPETTTLSADQKVWAQKFGISEDKVTARLKEFQDKGVMTYKPKEEQAPVNNPAPSGQPNPPAPAAQPQK